MPPPQAPDSPRSSQSPPPAGIQGDLELELLDLANALYNLGTTVINDSTKERDRPGQPNVKPVGAKVNEVVHHLARLDEMAAEMHVSIPQEVLVEIDNGRNPMQLTKDRIERAATENQFMNGKIAALDSYRNYLNEALVQNFPELEEFIEIPKPTKEEVTTNGFLPSGTH